MDLISDPLITGAVDQIRTQFDVWVHKQVFDNTFLIAGMGTVLAGFLSYLLKSVPARVWSLFLRACTVEVTINNDNDAFYHVMQFLHRRRIQWMQRTFLFGGHPAPGANWWVGPGYGPSAFLFERRLIIGTLVKEQSVGSAFKLAMTMRFFGRSQSRVARFVDAAKREAIHADRNTIDVLSVTAGGHWSVVVSQKPHRGLDTVFLAKDIKDELLDRLNWFYANEPWFRKRGMPYKFGVLLTGPGGTGKTSLIHAFASHFDKDIRLLNLNVLSDHTVGNMLCGLSRRDFLVIEDIDTFGVARDRAPVRLEATVSVPGQPASDGEEAERAPLSLSSLLNILDGVLSPDGVVTIATSNFPMRIDGPLLRKGRFDVQCEIGPLDPDSFAAMFVAFYGDKNRDRVDRFIRSGRYAPVVGAIAQDLFRHHGPAEALDSLSGQVSEIRASGPRHG